MHDKYTDRSSLFGTVKTWTHIIPSESIAIGCSHYDYARVTHCAISAAVADGELRVE